MIRERDNCTCRECGKTEDELGYKLSCHHIDYNKKNNDPSNVISLCKRCHCKTNFNRDNWISYYVEKVLEKERRNSKSDTAKSSSARINKKQNS